jgi:hypothetical protein
MGLPNLTPRKDLCDWLARNNRDSTAHPVLDMGFTKNHYATTFNFSPRCLADAIPKERLQKSRYQLIVDGFGYSYDSSFWKLSSNSTVFWLFSDTSTTSREKPWHTPSLPPTWLPWYYPLLQPGRDFFSVSIEEILPMIKYCEDHLQRCEEMAIRSRKILSRVNTEIYFEYVGHALKAVQEWQIKAVSAYRTIRA